jgi:hypothetical protein
VPSKLRSETVGVKPYRYWGLPDWRCHWPVERPHRPVEPRRIFRRKIPPRIIRSFSVRRKSRTSACRRSMCSTRKTLQHISSAKKSLGVVDVAAAHVAADVAADVAAEVAGAVAAVAVAEAAAGPGDIAASARAKSAATRMTDSGGRVLDDPAHPVLFAGRGETRCTIAGRRRRGQPYKWAAPCGKLH